MNVSQLIFGHKIIIQLQIIKFNYCSLSLANKYSECLCENSAACAYSKYIKREYAAHTYRSPT